MSDAILNFYQDVFSTNKEDTRLETQAFIQKINDKIEEQKTKTQIKTRITIDDVAESSRELAESFKCQICNQIA